MAASSSNNNGRIFYIPRSSLSRKSSLPPSSERPTATSAGGIRELENSVNNSSVLENPEPEALAIDSSYYDEGNVF